MKKLFSLMLLYLLVLQAPAQNYLTNGQVYNFNVGDVFESEDYTLPYGDPPYYYLTFILAKSYSHAADTIYYKDSNVTYSLSCMFCSWNVSTSVTTTYVTSLTSPATFDNMGNDCPLKDTLYTDSTNYCGKRVWEQYPVCSDSVFEPITTTSWVIEGCGGGYLSYYNPTCPCGDVAQLIYYKKGSDSCGSAFIVTGVDQPISKSIPIILYPNPSNSYLNISTSGTIYWYDIMDMSGRVIISETFPQDDQIDIESLARGNYVIGLYAKGYGRISKQFVKE